MSNTIALSAFILALALFTRLITFNMRNCDAKESIWFVAGILSILLYNRYKKIKD